MTAQSLFVVLVLAACGRDIPTVTRALVINVVYDPAKGNLPTPNDLAISATTGLVNAPIDDAGTPVQQEFTRDYLNTLNGFPLSTTVAEGQALLSIG